MVFYHRYNNRENLINLNIKLKNLLFLNNIYLKFLDLMPSLYFRYLFNLIFSLLDFKLLNNLNFNNF